MRTYSSTDGTEYTVTYDQDGYSAGETAHHWTATEIDGGTVSELWVQIDDEERPDLGEVGVSFRAGQVIQVETEPAYRREGIARQLYAIAYELLGDQLHHSPAEHRTDDGSAWADAVD